MTSNRVNAIPNGVKIIFAKKGLMRFISHLDLMRLFSRALRRGNLPIRYTCGFNPRPKLSFKRALKLGVESDNEELIVYLREQIDADEFNQKLERQLPEGIYLKDVSQLIG